jgi:hypothetical protein
MRTRDLVATVGASFGLLACASKSVPRTTSSEPAAPHWAGNFQPTQQRTGQLAVTGQNRAFGNVSIGVTQGGNLDRMRVNLSVAVPTSAGNSLRWAVLPERCGSGELPLIGFDQFPLIDVTTSGRGQVTADLPLVMAPASSYHVNVYSGSPSLENVVTCANLKFDGTT